MTWNNVRTIPPRHRRRASGHLPGLVPDRRPRRTQVRRLHPARVETMTRAETRRRRTKTVSPPPSTCFRSRRSSSCWAGRPSCCGWWTRILESCPVWPAPSFGTGASAMPRAASPRRSGRTRPVSRPWCRRRPRRPVRMSPAPLAAAPRPACGVRGAAGGARGVLVSGGRRGCRRGRAGPA